MLSSNKKTSETSEKMARLQFYDPVLFSRVLQFEWAILIVCAVGEGIAFRYAHPDPTAPNLGVSLILLAIFSLVSGFAPVRKPYWDRFCYLLLQLELVTGATAAGLARFIFPLFLIIVLKSCLLLDKRGIIAFQLMTFGAQIAYSCYKLALKNPEMLSHGLTPVSAAIILTQSFVYCYASVALVALVGMLTQSLVAEQKSRVESERLSLEVQNLATELERTRIAREIHDSLGHTLTSLNIQLEIARKFQLREPERCTGSLEIAKALASQSLTDVRMAIDHIRHGPNFDFKEAVSALVSDMNKMQPGMAVELNLENMDQMPSAVGFQLFRVIQECLTNVLKHSNASEVRIQLQQTAENLALTVCDNGKGLDMDNAQLTSASTSSGFGIKGMQERIASLNGTVDISAEQNKGTNIQVSIPLKMIEAG
jgi:signal transduction histidine kinase